MTRALLFANVSFDAALPLSGNPSRQSSTYSQNNQMRPASEALDGDWSGLTFSRTGIQQFLFNVSV